MLDTKSLSVPNLRYLCFKDRIFKIFKNVGKIFNLFVLTIYLFIVLYHILMYHVFGVN